MKKILSAFLLCIFASCASSPPTEEELAQEKAQATNECLSNPEMARTWGECNVKATIFSRKEEIAKCQAKHSKASQTMMLKISLQPSGKVKGVKAENGSAKNRRLENCLKQAMRNLQFAAPPSGATPTIMFPVGQ